MPMNKSFFNKLPFLAFAIMILIACSPKPAQQEYITIGALLPLTGEDSDEGLRATNGIQLAKNEINENGGILGKKLDIIILNDRGDEEYIVQQYNVLKKRDVVAIIGSSFSSVTLALAKAAEKDGIPIISPTASDPNVTKSRKNVFRAIFIDDYQAEAMAHFAYNSLGAKTAVVLSNDNFDSFKGAAKVFTESFEKFGGQVWGLESYTDREDFPVILDKYKANHPEVIFCPEENYPAATLVNYVFEANFEKTYILGSDAWEGLLTYLYNPKAMKNVYYSAPFSFNDQDENVSGFVKKYFDSFSQMPLSDSATAYTCVYILSEAIKKAGNTDKDDIISAMKANELEVITGRIKFDENNNPHINVYILQITGGEYSIYEKLSL